MEENKELIRIIFLISGGLFTILASVLNWDFFFGDSRAKIFTKSLGREGARTMYAILGFLLCLSGFLLIILKK